MEDNNCISRNEKKDYTFNNRQAARSAIAQLNGIDGSRDTLVSVGGVRIDRQGRCSCNGRQYVNIQVQVNRLRGDASDSTTIATALRLVETDERGNLKLPIRYIRDALIRSLQDKQPRQCRLQREYHSITRSLKDV